MDDNIVIESVFGLGEGIVSGTIKPDHYVISRELKILRKELAGKKIALVRDSSGKTVQVTLTSEKSKSQVLTDGEIKKYAVWALELEKHYGLPQDIEFAVDAGRLYIVQTRPITTLKKIKKAMVVQGKEILFGQPASPGIGSGEVKVILNLADLRKIVKGDILVTKMTNPDMVVTMQKAAAIVTDEGGATAHAAIVSREMGIPAVVGTGTATKVLKDGMYVTVDGFKGKIYEGIAEAVSVEIRQVVETETKIKTIVDLPSFAERASKTGVRSVGLVRIEGIIAESGMHPYGFLKEEKIDDYEQIVYKGISKIAEYFDELWIRTSDIRSDEFRNLKGSPKEPEANPMLGMHGIRAGLKYPEILKAELKAVKRLSENKQVGVMMPQIISVEEVQAVVSMLAEFKMDNVKLGVMVETPAACQIINDLCQNGIDFISFGTNDLTQFTLAIDRGNESVQYLYNEMHPAVLKQLADVIRVCKKYNVETSICGQAGSNKDMVEFLVKHGIDSISVNADKAAEISEFVHHLEKKGLKASELESEIMPKQSKKEEKAEEEEAKEEEQTEQESSEEKTAESGNNDGFADVDIGIDIFADHSQKEKSKNLDIY
jgi:pyruvate,water dikinase